MQLRNEMAQEGHKSVSASKSQSPRTDLHLQGFWLHLLRGAWIAFVLAQLVIIILTLFEARTYELTICPFNAQSCAITPATAQALHRLGIASTSYATYNLVLALLQSLVFLGIGGFIFWRKSDEPICLAASLVFVTIGLGAFYTTSTYPPAVVFGYISALCFVPALGFFLVAFPDGRFVPNWSWLLVVLFMAQGFAFVIPGPFNIMFWPPPLFGAELLLTYGGTLGVQIYRYVRVSNFSQRQQTKWLVFGLAGYIALQILLGLFSFLFPGLAAPDSTYQLVSGKLDTFLILIFPLSVGIAIQRSRLWDIDVLIRRTLVYALLTASTLGLYVLVVFGASALLRTQNDLFLSLLATALIAVLFQPLRQWLQHGVNRVMFGDRNEPYRVLSRLGQRLEETLPADTLLPTIVETVAHALKLPYVAIVWKREHISVGAEPQLLTAAFGTSTGSAADTRIPLVHQGKHLGELVLSPRQRGEELTPADLRLVRDLAPQIGMALHSALLLADLQHLTADLQRSREHLVTAREEERRRLRRDLHDGLGPQLASQTLTLTAARKLLRDDPDAAEALLVNATAHAQEAITDIRRLVYALRPPALDDLGLVAALREQGTQYGSSGVVIILEAPAQLPPLPAAVEVACYRIVQESLTNVVRHAHAHTCTIRLFVNESLCLEVTDDGDGLPTAYRAGVGLTSMRERAKELGGTCVIDRVTGGGTRVCAQLPLL